MMPGVRTFILKRAPEPGGRSAARRVGSRVTTQGPPGPPTGTAITKSASWKRQTFSGLLAWLRSRTGLVFCVRSWPASASHFSGEAPSAARASGLLASSRAPSCEPLSMSAWALGAKALALPAARAAATSAAFTRRAPFSSRRAKAKLWTTGPAAPGSATTPTAAASRCTMAVAGKPQPAGSGVSSAVAARDRRDWAHAADSAESHHGAVCRQFDPSSSSSPQATFASALGAFCTSPRCAAQATRSHCSCFGWLQSARASSRTMYQNSVSLSIRSGTCRAQTTPSRSLA
mmetsp:Transcript_43017/g.133119  ORF Transcript_43017/g.133119 Transcript_43017/m.133119 type:complete len:289 (-) Transcript_43017:687-1553(-)